MEVLEEIKKKYEKLSSDELLEVIAKLTSELARVQTMLWTKGRERSIDYSGMPCLFDEIEFEVDQVEKNPEVDSKAQDQESDSSKPKPEKKRGGRKPLPDYLPRVRVEVDLPEDQKICPHHQVPLEKIGEEVAEKLEIIPAKVEVKEIVTFTYKCPCCDSSFVQSQREPDPIPKSFASPSLLAYIATAKFVDGLPLYRQERIFDRLNIELNRSTMARWMVRLGSLVTPLINIMQDDLLASALLHADETEVQVLDEAGKAPTSKSYMWVIGRPGSQPMVLFQYEPHRSKTAALRVIPEFKGTLVADGYKAYESLGKALSCRLAACLAHIRRKFWQAEKVAKKEAKTETVLLSSQALAFIKRIYAIESELKGQPPDQILSIRQKKSKPIMESWKAWLDALEPKVLPSSPTGKAIAYALGQWQKMLVFLDNPLVPVDNNFIEASLRPFVVGRNSWLFSQSVGGAQASAALYSLVETAKLNGIDPHDYLTLIFKELPKADSAEDFEKLLPYQAQAHFSLKPYQVAK